MPDAEIPRERLVEEILQAGAEAFVNTRNALREEAREASAKKETAAPDAPKRKKN